MRKTFHLPFLTLALCAGAPALAGNDDDLVVTASGEEAPRSESGHAIAVLTAEDLDRLQNVSVAEALRTLPSVAVAQRGPAGSQTSLFIRGANSSQTLVVIDGIRVNDPSSPNGAFDFGGLMTGSIDRIELLRGANSVVWGSQAIGGVVLVETTAPADDLSVRLGGEYGYADTARAWANVAGRSGALSGGIGASWYRSDGISALAGGTERDGFDNLMLNARLRVALGESVWVEGNGLLIDGRIAYDSPFGAGANALPESDNRQLAGRIGAGASLLGGRWQHRIDFARTDIRRIGTDPVAFSFNNFRIFGKIDRASWTSSLDAATWLTLGMGLEHIRTRASTSFEGAAPDRADDRQTGGHILVTLRPAEGLTLNGGVRHDDYSDYGNRTTFSANVAWTPDQGQTIVRASYAEGFRGPTLSEGQPPFGNPALRPESSRGYDIGIEHALLDNRLRLSATLWQRNSRDLIAFSFATFRSENIEHARGRGVELTVDARPDDRLRFAATYSYTESTNRTAGALFGRDLALRPRHALTVATDWRTVWGPSVGATLTVTGDSFDNAANSVRLDGFALLGIRASVPIVANAEIFARCDNLFDVRYTVVSGYSTYGRNAHVGLRWRL